MLEKDVVELNPYVKFEDIAELVKAKEILQEAVLLPLLIPNFFKVNIKKINVNFCDENGIIRVSEDHGKVF